MKTDHCEVANCEQLFKIFFSRVKLRKFISKYRGDKYAKVLIFSSHPDEKLN